MLSAWAAEPGRARGRRAGAHHAKIEHCMCSGGARGAAQASRGAPSAAQALHSAAAGIRAPPLPRAARSTAAWRTGGACRARAPSRACNCTVPPSTAPWPAACRTGTRWRPAGCARLRARRAGQRAATGGANPAPARRAGRRLAPPSAAGSGWPGPAATLTRPGSAGAFRRASARLAPLQARRGPGQSAMLPGRRAPPFHRRRQRSSSGVTRSTSRTRSRCLTSGSSGSAASACRPASVDSAWSTP